MMKDFKLMPASVDSDSMVSNAFLSNVSRDLLASLGDTPPNTNARTEKVVGKVVTKFSHELIISTQCNDLVPWAGWFPGRSK